MKARKPIRRSRTVKLKSLRYEVVDGTYKRYPDGREVCLNNRRGWDVYRYRTFQMAERQCWMCGLCNGPMSWSSAPDNPYRATFQHGDGRGMGGARRNDDINAKGNCAACLKCNSELGSRRLE